MRAPPQWTPWSPWTILTLAALAGCSKQDSATAPAPSATLASATPASATLASVPQSLAPPSPSASAPPLAAPSSSARLLTMVEHDAAADGGGTECGKKGLPDCPLQGWMKRNTYAASRAGDLPTLAAALDAIAKMAPTPHERAAEYANWSSIASDGAAAARAGDLDATRASCTSCHKQYRAKYRAELRTRSVPSE